MASPTPPVESHAAGRPSSLIVECLKRIVLDLLTVFFFLVALLVIAVHRRLDEYVAASVVIFLLMFGWRASLSVPAKPWRPSFRFSFASLIFVFVALGAATSIIGANDDRRFVIGMVGILCLFVFAGVIMSGARENER